MILDPSPLSTEDIEKHSNSIVTDFVPIAFPDDPPFVDVECFSGEQEILEKEKHEAIKGRPIRTEWNNSILGLLINTDGLPGIPHSSLQGWLELEIILAMMAVDQEAGKFNFQKDILPLMPITGSGMYFIRELVEYLSRSIKKIIATKQLIKIGRGEAQVYYYLYTVNPTVAEKKFYEKYRPHDWMRASHLCGKLVQYTGLSCLADHGIGFSSTLKAEWQQQHGYEEIDQIFLDKMVAIASSFDGHGFSLKLVEMFKVLRDMLLLRSRTDTTVMDRRFVN